MSENNTPNQNRADDNPNEVDVHTEAVAFDPFADDEDTTDGTEVHTEAVPFDPFADDDEEDIADANAGTHVDTNEDTIDETEAHTEAVPFDPFADDDEDTDSVESFASNDPDEITGADEEGGEGWGVEQKKPVSNLEPGERSRREALSEFRRLRGTRRRGAQVAGGMVRLPFIPPTDPEKAVIDPTSAIEKGVEPQR